MQILIAILTSLVAAIVFWLITEKFFKRKQNDTIKRITGDNINTIYYEIDKMFFNLVSYFPVPEREKYSRYFSEWVISGDLTWESITYILNFKYPSITGQGDIVQIDSELEDAFKRISDIYSNSLVFFSYLPAEIIEILDAIKKRIDLYAIVEDIDSLAYNHHIIYKNFLKLGLKASKLKYSGTNIWGNAVKYYFSKGEYRKCRRILRKLRNGFRDIFDYSFWPYDLMCDYYLGDKDRVINRLNSESKIKLVFCTEFDILVDLFEDEDVICIFEQYYKEEELKRRKERLRIGADEKYALRNEFRSLGNN